MNIELIVVTYTLESGQQFTAQSSRFPTVSVGAHDGRGIRQRSADQLRWFHTVVAIKALPEPLDTCQHSAETREAVRSIGLADEEEGSTV